jgi:hypothetical protein
MDARLSIGLPPLLTPPNHTQHHQQFPVGTQVTFKADASLAGGMLIKGIFLSAAKYAEFVGACTQPGDKGVSEYEWGYGACDDWQTLAKAAALPSFTIMQVRRRLAAD